MIRKKGILTKLCLSILFIHCVYSVNAQCKISQLGNDPSLSGTHYVSWKSQLLINRNATYTSDFKEPRYFTPENFSFNAYTKGNPLTPFVVAMHSENEFTVLAIGETVSPNNYNVGLNSIPFSQVPQEVLIPPGITVAVGYMEGYPDGSGITKSGCITTTISEGDVWFTGSADENGSATIEIGKSINEGAYTYSGIKWMNKFNLELCLIEKDYDPAFDTTDRYFTVNTTADTPDQFMGDGICADEFGRCSLRAAIQETKVHSGNTAILFMINGDLNSNSAFPVITTPGKLLIDGLSAPGYNDHPLLRLPSIGYSALKFWDIDGIRIRGMNLSPYEEDIAQDFGLEISNSKNILIEHNVIRNRSRSIHANDVTDITIRDNDLRDSGKDCSNPTIYLEGVLASDVQSGMDIRNNRLGSLNAKPHALIKLYNCANAIISNTASSQANIQLSRCGDYDFPVLLYACEGINVEDLDLSYGDVKMEGIGVLSWRSTKISIVNNRISNRIIGINLDGGSKHLIQNNDLSGSGLNPLEGALTLENFKPKDDGLLVRDNQYTGNTGKGFTFLSMQNCEAITVGQDQLLPHIQLPSNLSCNVPIHISDSRKIEITGLSFTADNQLSGVKKGIWLDQNSSQIKISSCNFIGWDAAIHAESVNNIGYECNTSILNKNAILCDNNSTFTNLENNNFGCNGVAINQRGSVSITAPNNYWGHKDGSSSLQGFGDHIIGDVDVSDFANEQVPCADPINGDLCMGEICNNGIDDDLDGLIDCADGQCIGSPDCSAEDQERASCLNEKDLFRNLESNSSISDFSIYPNPNSGIFILKNGSPYWEYRIYDCSGKQLIRDEVFEQHEIPVDISHVPSGLYFAESLSSETVTIRSFIKH